MAGAYGGTGLLVAETITAGLHDGKQLWSGTERNIGQRLHVIAEEFAIEIHVAA